MNQIIFTYLIFVKKVKNQHVFNWTYGHSGNDYKVAALSKLYLTVIGIIIQNLKSIGQFEPV